MKVCFLYDGLEQTVAPWIAACQRLGLDYQLINLLRHDGLDEVAASSADVFYPCPPGYQEHLKTIFDERLHIVGSVMKRNVFPSEESVKIYENKRYFCQFARWNRIPTPRTDVYATKEEAEEAVRAATFPLVAKTSIGAAGTGVRILKSREEAMAYVADAFSPRGIKRRSGPETRNKKKMDLVKKAWRDPAYMIQRLKFYKGYNEFRQRGYVIFQQYIEHDYEIRVMKIGDEYSSLRKFKVGEMASGAKKMLFEAEPTDTFEFVHQLCERLGFDVMSVDLFEYEGSFVVNEMQMQWGHYLDMTMTKAGKRGVYKRENGEWHFVEDEGLIDKARVCEKMLRFVMEKYGEHYE